MADKSKGRLAKRWERRVIAETEMQCVATSFNFALKSSIEELAGEIRVSCSGNQNPSTKSWDISDR